MLREDGRQAKDAPAALSAEARLLLRADHDRGVHQVPADGCEICTRRGGLAGGGGRSLAALGD